jgi:hypothetical protein
VLHCFCLCAVCIVPFRPHIAVLDWLFVRTCHRQRAFRFNAMLGLFGFGCPLLGASMSLGRSSDASGCTCCFRSGCSNVSAFGAYVLFLFLGRPFAATHGLGSGWFELCPRPLRSCIVWHCWFPCRCVCEVIHGVQEAGGTIRGVKLIVVPSICLCVYSHELLRHWRSFPRPRFPLPLCVLPL